MSRPPFFVCALSLHSSGGAFLEKKKKKGCESVLSENRNFILLPFFLKSCFLCTSLIYQCLLLFLPSLCHLFTPAVSWPGNSRRGNNFSLTVTDGWSACTCMVHSHHVIVKTLTEAGSCQARTVFPEMVTTPNCSLCQCMEALCIILKELLAISLPLVSFSSSVKILLRRRLQLIAAMAVTSCCRHHESSSFSYYLSLTVENVNANCHVASFLSTHLNPQK